MDTYSKQKMFEENNASSPYLALPGFKDSNWGFTTSLHYRSLFAIHHDCLEKDIFGDIRESVTHTQTAAQR